MLKDVELAKKILFNENQRLVVVKDGEVIFKSKDRGIRPMYILSTEMKDKAKGASMADRVIGKGAALLCTYVDIKEVYGELMSQAGIEVLDKNNILYTLENSCKYIKNRDKTDLCPIERRSLDTDNPEELIERIEEFFKTIK